MSAKAQALAQQIDEILGQQILEAISNEETVDPKWFKFAIDYVKLHGVEQHVLPQSPAVKISEQLPFKNTG